MSEHRIATLAMKIFGLFVTFVGVQHLVTTVQIFMPPGRFDSFIVSAIVAALFYIGLGALIWVKAEPFARRTLPDGDRAVGQDAGQRLRTDTILSVAVAVLGIYFLVTGVAHAISATGLWVGGFPDLASEDSEVFVPPPPHESFSNDLPPDVSEQEGVVEFSDPAPGGRLVTFDDASDEEARREAYTAAGYSVAGILLLFGAHGLGTFVRRSWGDDDATDESQEP